MHDKETLEVVQKIGSEVCEGCEGNSAEETECGLDPNECSRIINAADLLWTFVDTKVVRP